MATRLINKRSAMLANRGARVVTYMPSLRAMVRHFRAFSSHDERHSSTTVYDGETSVEEPQTVWPDQHLGPFGPKDPRFPMPGMTGPHPNVRQPYVHVSRGGDRQSTPGLQEGMNDLLGTPLPEDRHLIAIDDMLRHAHQVKEQEAEESLGHNPPDSYERLECVAQECPALMRKDFQDLFVDRTLMDGPLTIITISQRTTCDQAGWSPDVEEEREELLANFVSGAQEICQSLQNSGYWADFIDPASGRPYLGAYTNATMYETDERYRQFGFTIDDLGCCKVIRHHLWGSHSFVGSLFTNATLDHPILRDMVHDTC